MSTTPLAGARVLDLTTTVSGPICTLRLAQYGAEVIKIETAGGDVMRSLGGPSPSGQHSGQYLHLNRGKKSVRLDLKSGPGRRAIQRLLATCDVLVSNMRLDALTRLGLGPQETRARQPALVHCMISGFGPGGPYAGRPAYDSVVQAVSGVAGLHLRRDGQAAYAPLLLADHVVGEIAAGAILAALVERGRTGVGAAIEVPMMETMAAFVLQEHLSGATFEPPVAAPGDPRIMDPGTRPLQTSDGWISVTANTDDQCRRFLAVIGRPELADDPRFRTVADRVRNMGAWGELRARALLARTTAEWLEAFAQADLAAAPCHTLEALIEDPHIVAVGLLQPDGHPVEGTIRAIRSPVLCDGVAAEPGTAASPLGHDTRAVLEGLGLADDDLAALCGGS